MPKPDNGIYIVMGEMSMVMTAMRRSSRWSSHSHQEEEQDTLLRNMSNLKDILNHIADLSDIEPSIFLSPFLDVIRSENIPAPITGHALSAIHKFLSYGLIDSKCESSAAAVENIADAVTHARFVGTDQGTDEIVLMKILQVLRLLLLTPVGMLLSNDSVCEIMQSCFRLCFEKRLSELLRKSAEHSLMDMVQLLFSRLPQFSEDSRWVATRKLHMRALGIDTSRSSSKKRSPHAKHKKHSQAVKVSETSIPNLATPATTSDDSGVSSLLPSPETVHPNSIINNIDSNDSNQIAKNVQESDQEKAEQSPQLQKRVINECEFDTQVDKLGCNENISDSSSLPNESGQIVDGGSSQMSSLQSESQDQEITFSKEYFTSDQSDSVELANGNSSSAEALNIISRVDVNVFPGNREGEYVNPRGVRFTAQQSPQEGTGPLTPYGLPCVRELFRFLVTLINPTERHNMEANIHIGLSLLTVALEAGADHIGNFNSLLTFIKDEACRNLFCLLSVEKLSVFAATLRACFLLFESLRTHLKFQLEMYLIKLMEIIVSESPRVPYEQREIALDSVSQLWRIPGLVTELYLNYDCNLYCSNLFEDLTKLLSKNAFPVSGLYSTHLLSLDALLAVIDSIESHCHFRILNESRLASERRDMEDQANAEDANNKDNEEQDMKDCDDILSVTSLSGYLLGQLALAGKLEGKRKDKEEKKGPYIRPNRMKVTNVIPSHEEIMAVKHKKKLLAMGTEQFNSQPSKGIAFLQEHGLLTDPLDPAEVAVFLRENPQLDKRMIGEYISNRKNLKVLQAFVRSFTFEDLRIDEALRQYLETFRLPGEAPLISLVLEHFAEHWHRSNGEPFAHKDAAFTLAYAVIMLNVDQHNHNVKRQNNPMTVEEFKKNLKGVNKGEDFEGEMLEEIYICIRNEEIVMPAEQTGLVRENYLWKVLLRRGSGKEGTFLHAPNGLFDHDLFTLIWGPTVAALSYVFDKSTDPIVIQKSISGFRKCAMISAHYGMSDVFDNLVISLCKFSTLLSAESSEYLPIAFGSNNKAHLACRTVFNLAHRHGDILREGWKNLLDCVLQLYRAKLLPAEMVEAEDFVNPEGVICLIREEKTTMPRTESGILSSFYSYITQTSDSQVQRGPTPEDEAAKQAAQDCITDCHPEQLITESKFLRVDSLQELVKTLVYAYPEPPSSVGGCYDEDATVFLTELLIKIALQNRDRLTTVWPSIRDYLYRLVMEAAATDRSFLLERSVVGILRIAIRMVRREEMIPEVLHSLRMLLLLKPTTLICVSRQIAHALHELLRTSAANIHSSQDWSIIFTLMECVGAGAKPPRALNGFDAASSDNGETDRDTGAQSDGELSIGRQGNSNGLSDRGYTSDSELYDVQGLSGTPRHNRSSQESVGSVGGWTLVNREGEVEPLPLRPMPVNQYNIILQEDLLPHDPFSFAKTCDSLAFLVRDAAHITTENFESCVHCLRVFVEASIHGGHGSEKKVLRSKTMKEKRLTKTAKWKDESFHLKRTRINPRHIGSGYDADDETKAEDMSPLYLKISIQLLDLMHTLHTRAATIFTPWTDPMRNIGSENMDMRQETPDSVIIQIDSGLWATCWCPLLQGIARLCCDTRKHARTSALTFLQRALLVHDLQILSATEWEACFNKVLFPLLAKLLENINVNDPHGMEETRMRGSALLCKVFLQHLNPLLSLPTFTALWLTILDFMDKYMHADGSDLLNEAIPESLKNMLLVMNTAEIFHPSEDGSAECQLWNITWDRINTFLPNLKEEVFKPSSSDPSSVQAPSSEVSPSLEKCQQISNSSSVNIDTAITPGVQTKPLPQSGVQTKLPAKDSSEASEVAKEYVPFPRPTSPLTTNHDLQSAPSVILHPPAFPFNHASPSYLQPVATLPTSTVATSSTSHTPCSTSAPAVPLLLNPSVMGQAPMPMFSPPQPSRTRSGSLR